MKRCTTRRKKDELPKPNFNFASFHSTAFIFHTLELKFFLPQSARSQPETGCCRCTNKPTNLPREGERERARGVLLFFSKHSFLQWNEMGAKPDNQHSNPMHIHTYIHTHILAQEKDREIQWAELWRILANQTLDSERTNSSLALV